MPPAEAADDRPATADLFVSYASPDLAKMEVLHSRLNAEGFSVWFDKLRPSSGCRWHDEIKAGYEAVRVMLPLITPRGQKSSWTRFATYASGAIIPPCPRATAER